MGLADFKKVEGSWIRSHRRPGAVPPVSLNMGSCGWRRGAPISKYRGEYLGNSRTRYKCESVTVGFGGHKWLNGLEVTFQH